MPNSWDEIVGTKAYNDNLIRIKSLAEEKGYSLNPDESRLQKVIGLMTLNKEKYGDYYCPCKQSFPLNPMKDTLCPCQQLDQEVFSGGNCHCKLFYGK